MGLHPVTGRDMGSSCLLIVGTDTQTAQYKTMNAALTEAARIKAEDPTKYVTLMLLPGSYNAPTLTVPDKTCITGIPGGDGESIKILSGNSPWVINGNYITLQNLTIDATNTSGMVLLAIHTSATNVFVKSLKFVCTKANTTLMSVTESTRIQLQDINFDISNTGGDVLLVNGSSADVILKNIAGRSSALMDNGFNIQEASIIDIDGCNLDIDCAGAVARLANIANLYLQNSKFSGGSRGIKIENCPAFVGNGINVKNNTVFNIAVDESSTANSSTGMISVLGDINPNKIYNNSNGASIAAMTKREDSIDRIQYLIGSQVVGNQKTPSELFVGEGCPDPSNLTIYQRDPTSIFHRIDSGGYGDAITFDSETAGNCLYIGSTFVRGAEAKRKHYGFQYELSQTMLGGTIVFEYYDGATWQEFDTMTTSSSFVNPSELSSRIGSFGNNPFLRQDKLEELYYSLQPLSSEWEDNSEPGVTFKFMRIRITSLLTRKPIFKYIRLHCNSSCIRGNGTIQYYGNSRVWQPLWSSRDFIERRRDTFGSDLADVQIGGVLTGWDHQHGAKLRNASADEIYGTFTVTEGLDTSTPLKLAVWYQISGVLGGSNPIQLKFDYIRRGIKEAKFPDGTSVRVDSESIDTAGIAQNIGTISIPKPADTNKIFRYVLFSDNNNSGLKLKDYYPGDLVFFRLTRVLSGGYTGILNIHAVEVYGSFYLIGANNLAVNLIN